MSRGLLAHNVYFTLKNGTAANRTKLLQSIGKHLTGHPGTLFFASGILEDSLQRPVNDRNFDVAVHVVFENLAAFGRYMASERRQQWVNEHQESWKQVRVFDSILQR